MDGSPSLNLETAAWMVADEGVLGVREGEEDGWRGRLLRGVDGPAESGEIERLAKCTRRVALLPASRAGNFFPRQARQLSLAPTLNICLSRYRYGRTLSTRKASSTTHRGSVLRR